MGWRAMLPNEKHEFSVGWRAAQKGGLAGCTTGQASGLHIKAGRRAAHYAGLRKRAGRRAALFCSTPRPFPQPTGPPFCAARPALSVFSAAHHPTASSHFSFGSTALQLVLSQKIGFNSCECMKCLNIANFHAFDVWGKLSLSFNGTTFFLVLFFFLILLLQRNFFPLRLRHQTSATKRRYLRRSAFYTLQGTLA